MRIRPETPGDVEAIARLTTAAFGQPDEARLIEAIRGSSGFVPALSLVAVEDGTVVGHILFSIVHIETGGGDIPTLTLAPMAVQPEWQRQGLGSALVAEGLARCAAAGYAHVNVLGHAAFYPRFGFSEASRFGIRCPVDVPDEAFLFTELQPGSLAGAAGVLRYPDAFLQCL